MSDIIAACATALRPSAIGVVRLSGAGCIEAAEKIFTARNGKPLGAQPDRLLTLGVLHDRQGRGIDEILAAVSHAPNSYTGEDTVELQCHGSPAVLAAALEALFALGVRQALPGEFTKRAFLNGRMDLTQAEAVVDLIDAQTADAAANAAGQVGGLLTKKLAPVEAKLTDVLAHFHAVLDYPDDDVPPFETAAARETIADCRAALAALAETFSRGQVLKNGVRAAIIGAPNAGKSSLLNALAGYERVIVTEIAGTTRDTVEEPVRLGGTLLRLVDTAGIRKTEDAVESLGVERARQAAEEAELAIFVCDGSRPLTDADRAAMEEAKRAKRVIAVRNKCDLPAAVKPEELPFARVLTLSAKTGEGLAELEREVEALFGSDAPCDGGILTNARQYGAVCAAAEVLGRAGDALDTGISPDAVLLDVEQALERLGEITGKSMREEVLARIFERFCVGK